MNLTIQPARQLIVSIRLIPIDKADTSSAVVQLAEEIDESAPHVRRRLPATRCGEQRSPVSLSVDTLESMNNVSTDNADTSSAVVKLAEEIDESAPQQSTCPRCAAVSISLSVTSSTSWSVEGIMKEKGTDETLSWTHNLCEKLRSSGCPHSLLQRSSASLP